MKKLLLFTFLLTGIFVFGRTGKTSLPEIKDQVYFIANQGQWPAGVQFLVKMNGVNAWITDRGMVYDYYKLQFPEGDRSGKRIGHVVNMSLGQKIAAGQMLAKEKQQASFNYFMGDNPARWVSGVALYKSVTITEVYPGIDMELYIDRGCLRYDFVLKPGADPQQIKLEVSGSDGVDVQNGNLIIKTTLGDRLQGDIHAFQDNKTVACRLEVTENVVTFNIGEYDKNKPLRIDPLVYSTYLGGASDDAIRDVVLDGSDNVYMAGYTWSADFPVTAGAYQQELHGADDVFVTGFSQDGQNLLFSTYIGGGYSDEAFAIAYDEGRLYLTGLTYSEDFPVTEGAFQDQNHLGGDVFVASLTTNGQNLGFATYVGGAGYEIGNSIDIGEDLYICGYTGSDDFPVTGNAYDNSFGGDSFINDGFVFKMSTSGAMLYASYLGGYGDDQINGVAVDPLNPDTYYLVGQTTSSDFPVTGDAFDNQLGSGGSNEDAFVAEFSGNQLNYSTFLGGASTDYASSVAVNANHQIMVAGATYSDDFPVTPDAFSSQIQGVYMDAFISVLRPDGDAQTDDLHYSSYFGGLFEEEVFNVFLTGQDKLYITGYTASLDFPTTPGAVSQENTGNKDVFVTRFNFSGNTMDYSTYLGGSFNDVGYGLGEKQNGQIVVAGLTTSSNFPVTGDAFDPSFNEGNSADAFFSFIDVVPNGVDEQPLNSGYMSQNEPNPFSSETVITYRTDTPGDVVLTVCNAEGKTVLQQSASVPTSGSHQIKLNMTGFASGFYFYTMKTEHWTETRKMIVR